METIILCVPSLWPQVNKFRDSLCKSWEWSTELICTLLELKSLSRKWFTAVQHSSLLFCHWFPLLLLCRMIVLRCLTLKSWKVSLNLIWRCTWRVGVIISSLFTIMEIDHLQTLILDFPNSIVKSKLRGNTLERPISTVREVCYPIFKSIVVLLTLTTLLIFLCFGLGMVMAEGCRLALVH